MEPVSEQLAIEPLATEQLLAVDRNDDRLLSSSSSEEILPDSLFDELLDSYMEERDPFDSHVEERESFDSHVEDLEPFESHTDDLLVSEMIDRLESSSASEDRLLTLFAVASSSTCSRARILDIGESSAFSAVNERIVKSITSIQQTYSQLYQRIACDNTGQ